MARSLPERWRGFVARTREPTWGKLSAGIANVRVPVRVHPHDPPDPADQGGAHGILVQSRPAVAQVFTSYHDTNAPAEGRFVALIVGPNPRAAYPAGRQAPFYPRANIKVPPHVAYGSLFQDNAPPYGLG